MNEDCADIMRNAQMLSCENGPVQVSSHDATALTSVTPLLSPVSLDGCNEVALTPTSFVNQLRISTPRSPSLSASSLSSFALSNYLSPQARSLGSAVDRPPSSQMRRLRHNRSRRKQTVVNKYCEEMNELNEPATSRPRNALIHSIQQENRHIRELQRENKELRSALEEHQNIMELIMSKYRQQIAKLVSINKDPNTTNNSAEQAKLASQMERINEMVAVMRKAAQLGDDEYCEQQRLITTLTTENKGLREMLQIAVKSGSLLPSRVSDANTQTEATHAQLTSNFTDQHLAVNKNDSLSPEVGAVNGLSSES